jgi:methionyl-tRNA formyltransferase
VIDEGMDTGPLLLSREVPILPDDDAGTLTERLAQVGAQLAVDTLDALQAGAIRPRPQPRDGVSLAPKVTPAEARLDFTLPAERLHHAVRAFAPTPGAWTLWRGRRLKVLRSAVAPPAAAPPPAQGELALGPGGTLLAGTGDGALELRLVQPEGRRAMPGGDFARGARLAAGARLGV